MVHIYLEDANFPTVTFTPEFVNPRRHDGVECKG